MAKTVLTEVKKPETPIVQALYRTGRKRAIEKRMERERERETHGSGAKTESYLHSCGRQLLLISRTDEMLLQMNWDAH
jgi:hypothetical protein